MSNWRGNESSTRLLVFQLAETNFVFNILVERCFQFGDAPIMEYVGWLVAMENVSSDLFKSCLAPDIVYVGIVKQLIMRKRMILFPGKFLKDLEQVCFLCLLFAEVLLVFKAVKDNSRN